MTTQPQAVPQLPPIGLGTMRRSGDACTTLVEAALSLGYRHLDTARRYGNEAEVGAGVRRSSVPRDQIIVTSKLGLDENLPTRVRPAVEDSLRTLGLDHLDLLLVHWPSLDIPLAETLGAMEALRVEGKVRGIGVANVPGWMLDELPDPMSSPLVTDQVEYHLHLPQHEVARACRDRGMVLTAYCPLGRGGRLLEEPLLRTIAADHGWTPAQVALRWVIQQAGVCAIPGTGDPEHLADNLAVSELLLTDEEMRLLDTLADGDRVVDPPHAPPWD